MNEFSESEEEGQPVSKEKFLMFLKANKEAASHLDLEQLNIVITEGIFKLCTSLGTEIDGFITELDPELMEKIARTQTGRGLINIIATVGDAMVMIMESIHYMKLNFPEYEKFLNEFHSEIEEKIKNEEEKLVQEFVDSIPDAIDFDE